MEWYEEIGLEQNPFIDTEDTQLVGYEDILEEIFYRIAAGDMLFIEGKEGNGKTALLKRVIARFRGKGKIIYLDGKKLDKNVNIGETLKNSMGFWSKVMGKKPRDMILLMDDVEELTRKNSERIKYYYDQNHVRSVIFTGTNYKTLGFTESLKERVSKVIKLKELTEDDVVDIVKMRLGNNEVMPENIIRDIYKKSNKNMKTLMVNCSKVLNYTIGEKREKTVTKEDVNIVLGGMKTEEREEKKKEAIEIKVEKIEDERYKPTTITIIDDDFKPVKEAKQTKESQKKEKEKKDLAEEYY